MKFRDFIRMNPFTVIFLCAATVLCGLTFVFSAPLAIGEIVVVLGLAVFAFFWFSNSVERKKTYLRRIENALTESGENYDRLAAFPFPAVLSDPQGSVLWFNEAFNAVTADFPDASASEMREYIGSRFDFSGGDCAPFEVSGASRFYTVFPSRLADGSGGLSEVQLRVSHGERQIGIALREATEERLAALGLEGTLPTMDGQGYRAWRQYCTRDGEEWVQVQTAFVKPPVLYTLDTAVPAAEEDAAALDLRDLLLAYARTPVPDLGSLPPPED